MDINLTGQIWVMPFNATLIQSTQGNQWQAFLPPFFGVLAAFGINYLHQLYKNRNDRIKYIGMIRSEIVSCLDILEQDRIRILPIDRWTSILNSGGLKLFDVDKEIEPLTKVYSHIQRYNHYPWWNVEFDKWSDAKKDDSFDKERMDDRELLLSEIGQLKSEEWIKAKSWR